MQKSPRLCLVLAAAFLTALTTAPHTAAAQEILIGTGSTSGVYHQVGRALCRLIERDVAGVTCKAQPTDGSVFNLDNVRVGALDLGLVQADVQFYAANKSGPFAFVDIDYANIRSLFSLHTEAFTLVARRDAGIGKLDDIKGRRVNIGNPGSGHRATMEAVMTAKGWTAADFLLAEELRPDQQALSLCQGRVEAMVYTVGHPNEAVNKTISLCEGQLVEASDSQIEKLLSDRPYYSETHIPGGLYEGIDSPTRTFGLKATAVISEDLDEELAYGIVKVVFDNLEQFRRMHPALTGLTAEEMMAEGLSAPLHPGAVRYFSEAGMM